jgi:hypothetical protein
MAAIVYLDVDDEITSAAARIRTHEDDRIALVLPLGSRLATSRINFRLLAREAEARGKRIEIVTNDASARALAASAGLPTHLSVAAFEAPAVAASAAPVVGPAAPPVSTAPPAVPPIVEDDSPTTAMPAIRPPAERAPVVPRVGRTLPRSNRPLIAAIFGLAGLIAVGGAAAFTLLPSADITLVPASDTVGPIELNIIAQAGVTEPNLANLLVPATRFTFDLEATNTFPATGLKVTETAATGEVTFSNLDTGSSNDIPSGSIVETQSGIQFRTVAGITLPQAEIGIVDGKFVVIPSTEKVGIQAVAVGTSGNVAANTIVVVPKGENAKRTTVTNEAATGGGTHAETPQIQQSDIDAALRALDDALLVEFDAQIAAATDVPEGTTLFPETKSVGATAPSVDPATLVGKDAADFELGLAGQGTVVGVDPGPVATLAEARIRTAVDNGFRLVDDSIVIEDGQPIVTGTSITYPVTVRATEISNIDGAALLSRVRGLGLPQARTILREYGAVEIAVWPDWVTTIPDSGRATLSIEEPPGPSASPGAESPGAGTGSPETSP